MLFDTHCHLDYLKQAPTDEILQKSLDAGVSKMVTISTEPDNLDEVIRLANKYPDVIYCTQGIHPHDAKNYNQQVREKIISNAQAQKQVVAIGEIGLDYHYDFSPKDLQKTAFEQQMQIAVDLKLPIVIHTREAEDDTWDILKNFITPLNNAGVSLVLHSFTSHISLAEKALEAGFHIGFNGIVTFKNAKNVREVLDIVPIEKMLLETDAPFLTPTPFRGRENAPFYLPHTAEFIAKHREWDVESFYHRAFSNSLKFFQL